MGLADMIADDLVNVVDDTVEVTVRLFRNGETDVITVPNSQREPIGRGMTNYAGYMLMGDESIFHVAHSQLNPNTEGREIRVQDEIVHGNVTYIVQSVSLRTLGTRWACVCRNKM